MGVPAFFRWLSRKYPSIVVQCYEEKAKTVDGVTIPVDFSQPNPNNVEFDNLYLDMNGIIHPCCHPEDKPAPKDEEEMMVAIFEYIDRLMRIVRPRRLLYMAIDGVAPRAKMNQQRSRRFRASKEVCDKIDEIACIRASLEAQGLPVPPEKNKDEHFDSNCITPGTPFMDRLAICLHYYVHERLNSDVGWRNLTVILSDANVPGEGEHKIMDFIRKQRSSPAHDANTRHCLCGADADLIMLGLATHEPNFTIIREEFVMKPRPCELCGQIGHELKDCMGLSRDAAEENNKIEGAEVNFIFLRLNVLREYLERELQMTNLPFPHDIERAIDDWVFMCFFVGNDFLPHLPSLEIREGAIDRLITLYKNVVYKTGGYLADNGMVNLDRVQLILSELGKVEDEIFRQRQEKEVMFREREKAKKRRKLMETQGPRWVPGGQFAPVPITSSPMAVSDARHEAYQMRLQGMTAASSKDANQEQQQQEQTSGRGQKRKWDEAKLDQEKDDDEPADDVRLWEEGWKDRYYERKFEVPASSVSFRHTVAAAYARGLCWVLQYYYQGCPSWKWFFPYHYAPFASDFVSIGDLSNAFEKGTMPFKPLEQLMGVFPAASKKHLPEPWATLMYDPDSTIIDFYPIDFRIDLNGKKFAWQGVALLPFVDERRLLSAVAAVYPALTTEEVRRNARGDDRMYVGRHHQGHGFLLGLYEGRRDYEEQYQLDATLFQGIGGRVLLAEDVVEPGGMLRSPIPGCDDVPLNGVCCVRYRDPKYDDDHIFLAKRLESAKDPPRVLRPEGPEGRDWRPVIGMAPSSQQASLDMAGRRMLGRAIQNAMPSGGGGQWNSGDRDAGRRGGGGGQRRNWPRGGDTYAPRRNDTTHSGFGRPGSNYNYQQQQQQYQTDEPFPRGWSHQRNPAQRRPPYNNNNRPRPY